MPEKKIKITKCDGCPMNISHWNFSEAEFTCAFLNKVILKTASYRECKKYPFCNLKYLVVEEK